MPRHKKNRPAERKVATQSAAARSWPLVPAGLLLILLTTFLIYSPAMHGGLVWDDDVNLTRPELQSLHGLYRIWFDPVATARNSQYYPLVHTAFWIEHKLWGDDYVGYHLMNVLWHSIAVLLVYSIVKKLHIPGALLAAAIFAVHPVMVESVAWMTEQKNTLSTVLYLGAMLVYLEFDESRLRSRYLISLGLFALALFAKTATVTFPFALLVVIWWQRGRIAWRRDVLPLIPFFALSFATGLMTVWVETKLVGAEGSEFELTFLQRFLLAGRDVWFYLGKLVWPTNLSFTYTRWNINPAQWWQWTFSIAALVATFALWSIRKRWRGPLAAWLFFCGTLVPVLGFVNVYMFRFTFVADHLQYLPSLGTIVLISAGIALGLARASLFVRRVGVALCIFYLGVLGTLSYQQSGIYANIVTLYQTTLELNPGSWMAHNNLGFELASKGKSDEAIDHYRSSLRINPKSANAYNNLGKTLTDLGRLPEATEALRAALALEPNNPVILNNLGRALIHSSQFPEAKKYLEHSLALEPDYAEAHINMGLVLGFTGKIPEAIDQFRLASQLNPYNVDAQNNWGLFLDRSGNLREAAMHYQQAITLGPNRADVRSNLADVLRLTGRPVEAIDHYRIALRLKPDHMQAYAGLAQALGQIGESKEAIAMAKKSIELARSTGQAAATEYMENWLKHYQSELPGASGTPSSP
jgi:tetratricopeptide (TPR) repeat protein